MIMRRLSPLIVALAMGVTMGTPAASAQVLHSSHAVLATLSATVPADPRGKQGGDPKENKCESGKSDDHRQNPQCQAPEAPVAIGLPLTALVIFGGYVLLMRRRDDRDAAMATGQS